MFEVLKDFHTTKFACAHRGHCQTSPEQFVVYVTRRPTAAATGVCYKASNHGQRIQRAGMGPGPEQHLLPPQEERADEAVS